MSEDPNKTEIVELASFEPAPSAGQSLAFIIAMVGIGFLVHGWLLGPTFDPTSVWSWGYIIAWPVVLVLWLLGWVLVPLAWGLAAAGATLGFFFIRDRLRAARKKIERKEAVDQFVKASARKAHETMTALKEAQQQAESEAFQQNISAEERPSWVSARAAQIYVQRFDAAAANQ